MTHQYKKVKIVDLFAYANNARTHSDEQIDQIAKSIKKFGITAPILINESNVVIAGHGRLEAMKKLDIKETPAVELKGLTKTEQAAYRLADNQLALNAGWDKGKLSLEIEHLSQLDVDLDLDILGFDNIELGQLLTQDEEKEITEQSYSEVFNIIVECKDETEQEKIFNHLDGEGYKCRVQSL